WNRSSPAFPPTTQMPASTFNFTNWGGSARLRHSGYLAFLFSETGLSFSAQRRYLSPYLELPSGNVLIHSTFPDSTTGVPVVQCGGASARNTTNSTSWDLTNQLSWFSSDNKHRLKLTSEIRRDDWTLEQASNLMGTFTFNSLADVSAKTPSSFSR